MVVYHAHRTFLGVILWNYDIWIVILYFGFGILMLITTLIVLLLDDLWHQLSCNTE